MEAYRKPEPVSTVARPERRGVTRRRIIEEAKSRVETIDLAERLCGPGGLRRVGGRWVGRCPLPDHADRSPSFTVYPQTNSWYCFGACRRGGDVVDLAAAAWGYGKDEAAMAAADVLHEFGFPPPERPPAWYARRKRQKPIRDAIEAAKVAHIQRRVFRRFAPLLAAIEDEDERAVEASLLWDAAGEVAALIWAGRRVA